MDAPLTVDEFNTFARTGEIWLGIERNEAKIAYYLHQERGWLDYVIRFEKDTDEGWLHMWVEPK